MVLLWLTLALVVIWVFHSSRKPKNMPPGPANIPVIGRILSVNPARPEEVLTAWHKQYGDIYSVKLGPTDYVVLSEPSLIREAFGRCETTGRPVGLLFETLTSRKGLVHSDGEQWLCTRRFTLQHLRNFSMANTRLEEAIRRQADSFLVQIVGESEGQPLDIDILEVAIFNIIWDIIAGQTLDIEDDLAYMYVNKWKEAIGDYTATLTLSFFMPWLLKIFPTSILKINELKELKTYARRHLIAPAIARHREHYDPRAEPSDLIESFLLEQQRDGQLFSDDVIVQSLQDLLEAGAETTAISLCWVFCCLCARPDVQQRLQAEVDEVVGPERRPTLADRSRMPYTEAVLMETQRVGDVVPSGVEHVATAPFQLAGYTIPAGTQITALLTAIHHSPRFFPQPEEFRPERFLDASGHLQPSKNLLPFSVGKRACLGEAMARSVLFLFVTMTLQRYSLRFPDGFHHDLSYKKSGSLTAPKPFQVVATPR